MFCCLGMSYCEEMNKWNHYKSYPFDLDIRFCCSSNNSGKTVQFTGTLGSPVGLVRGVV